MTMVLRIDSKSPIHHVREGRLGVTEVRSLDRIPEARQGRALLSTTTNIKEVPVQGPSSAHPRIRYYGWRALVHVKARRRVECTLSGLMSVFLSSLSGSPSTVPVVC